MNKNIDDNDIDIELDFDFTPIVQIPAHLTTHSAKS